MKWLLFQGNFSKLGTYQIKVKMLATNQFDTDCFKKITFMFKVLQLSKLVVWGVEMGLDLTLPYQSILLTGKK